MRDHEGLKSLVSLPDRSVELALGQERVDAFRLVLLPLDQPDRSVHAGRVYGVRIDGVSCRQTYLVDHESQSSDSLAELAPRCLLVVGLLDGLFSVPVVPLDVGFLGVRRQPDELRSLATFGVGVRLKLIKPVEYVVARSPRQRRDLSLRPLGRQGRRSHK